MHAVRRVLVARGRLLEAGAMSAYVEVACSCGARMVTDEPTVANRDKRVREFYAAHDRCSVPTQRWPLTESPHGIDATPYEDVA